MDFKVAGTKDAITAIQMDTKIDGLNQKIVEKAILQAKDARQKILKMITEVIPESRKDISKYAPRIEFIKIPIDFIGKLIGPSGKIVKQISADYEVDINIDDDGVVNISGTNNESIESAKKIIDGIVNDPIPGEVYQGKVTRIQDFGAFVEIFPGKEGLLHISKISKQHVKNIHDYLKVGQQVEVKLLNIDSQNRLNFSMVDVKNFVETKPKEKANF
jgi:polyribonucleotide nucleotidyltransferase